jgi:hypothetical protein
MRRLLVLVSFAGLAGCGAPGRDAVVDAASQVADAGPDATPACPSTGEGWVRLGPEDLGDALAPGALLQAFEIVGDPVPTIGYTTGSGGITRAALAEYRDGAWQTLGPALEPTAMALQAVSVVRQGDDVWLASTDLLSSTDFGDYTFADVDVHLDHWDGAAWREPPAIGNVLAHHGSAFSEQPYLPVALRADGTALIALKEYVAEPVADGPWPGRVRVAAVSPAGQVTRSLAELPGWAEDGIDRFPTAIHALPGRDLVVITEYYPEAARVLVDAGAGWAEIAAGPLPGHPAGVTVLDSGRIVVVLSTGRTYASDGQSPWAELDLLPIATLLQNGQLLSMRTRGPLVAWHEYIDAGASQRYRVARLEGDAWRVLEIGVPEPLADLRIGAGLAFDACERPLLLARYHLDASNEDVVSAWRFEGEGTPID